MAKTKEQTPSRKVNRPRPRQDDLNQQGQERERNPSDQRMDEDDDEIE
jgi:hypothetical protein